MPGTARPGHSRGQDELMHGKQALLLTAILVIVAGIAAIVASRREKPRRDR